MGTRATMFLAAACGGTETTTDDQQCVEPQLDLWCFHSEADAGPVVPDNGPATCDPPTNTGSRACDPYEVVFSGPDLSGINHYFLDGTHVATQYWTDVDSYCGGFVFWYGEVIANCR